MPPLDLSGVVQPPEEKPIPVAKIIQVIEATSGTLPQDELDKINMDNIESPQINDVNNDGLRLSIVTPGMNIVPVEGNGAGNIADGESDKNIKFNVTFRK